MLRAMMSQANLFENTDGSEGTRRLAKLNELVRRYAGGSIEKLRPSGDNTIDLRIIPTGAKTQDSFTFDGLSSGQKEIISTLFLIWRYTLDKPGIVLIDEPELHLNAEWHSDFIHQLHALAPWNQYIVATHSEEIFASVSEERRVLLAASGKASK
jgi:predicted ATPase